MNKIKLTYPLLLAFLLCACTSKTNNDTPSNETEKIIRPVFDEDTAFAYIEKQVSFGPRVPNTIAHEKCADFLIEELTRWTDTVYVQAFEATAYNGQKLKSKNIIGVFNKEQNNRILLAAHWDSRPYADNDADIANSRKPIDGANDGGSGVGVLLEIARQLHQQRPNVGIDIVFFDAEDYGEPQDERHLYEGENWCLGSQYWAKNPHLRYYKAKYGILLDMVGGKSAVFCKEGTSKYFASNIQDKIWNNAHKLGYAERFSNNVSNAITDDHLYVNSILSIPMIDIIEMPAYSSTGFNATWHTMNDNIDNIDKNTLKIVGEVVLFSIKNEQ